MLRALVELGVAVPMAGLGCGSWKAVGSWTSLKIQVVQGQHFSGCLISAYLSLVEDNLKVVEAEDPSGAESCHLAAFLAEHGPPSEAWSHLHARSRTASAHASVDECHRLQLQPQHPSAAALGQHVDWQLLQLLTMIQPVASNAAQSQQIQAAALPPCSRS